MVAQPYAGKGVLNQLRTISQIKHDRQMNTLHLVPGLFGGLDA